MKTTLKTNGRVFKAEDVAAIGQCDYSGMLFKHSDLKKQMEWRGNNLVWTGFLVGKPFLDIPQQQNRPPKNIGDPKVINNPRIPDGYTGSETNPTLPLNQLLAKLNNFNWYN